MINNRNGQSAAKQIQSKPIKGFEGLYEITNDGNVYSFKSNKFLKPRLSMDGYKRVCLYNNGNKYEYRVARLVAQAFIPNPQNKLQVNHLDYNTVNDYVSNLEWCDDYDNSHYSFDAGRFMIPETYKTYRFTNIYNGKSFNIIGIRNVAKQFGCSMKNFKACITRYANTGYCVKQGLFKGLRIDSEYLNVQRLGNCPVDSSESKCETPEKVKI